MRAFRAGWRWSWLVTLPLLVGFVYWAQGTWNRYWSFQVRHSTSENFTLWSVGRMEAQHLLRKLAASFSARPATRSGLRTFEVSLPEGARARLDSNLPQSGFDYVDGRLVQAGAAFEVKLRYRGDNVYHWGYYKKSWRVRTKRGDLFEGMRSFNLIAPRTPEVLNNHLSHELGRLLGLVSPRTELVRVVVNGVYDGVYVLTEQLDESTIRSFDRMPGDIYSGEIIARDQPHGVEHDLFRNVGLWEKVAVNNHYPVESMAPLERLVGAVSLALREDRFDDLLELVDVDAFARFSLLETLTTTAHFDRVHNWRLYYDPWKNHFQPIVWDPVGWHRGTLPPSAGLTRLDVITSPLHEALHRSFAFLRARQRAAHAFFSAGHDARFLALVDETIASTREGLRDDSNHAANVAVVDWQQCQESLDSFAAGIGRVLADTRHAYMESATDVSITALPGQIYGLTIHGRRPVHRLVFRFLQPLPRLPQVAISHFADGTRVTEDVTANIVTRNHEVQLDSMLMARWVPQILTMQPGRVIGNRMDIRPAYYELSLRGVPEDVPLFEILHDLGDGHLVPTEITAGTARSSFEVGNDIVDAAPPPTAHVIEGQLEITGVRHITAETIIRPGTVLRLAPDASLIFHNRVTAKGSAEAPIRFVPSDPRQPWGTVAIRTHAADGSHFSHCHFTGGSGLKSALAEYSSMFSIHAVDDVVMSDCSFEDGRVVDDMVHAVYSRVTMERCRLERALSDALDLDICTAHLMHCQFVDSGNDGVDLMTTRAVITDCTFEGNGDKGISIGEGSSLIALRNRFEACNKAMEAKDGSVAHVANCEIARCRLAVNAYKKNWRYDGGGDLTIYKSMFEANTSMPTADPASRVLLVDCGVDGPLPEHYVDELGKQRPNRAETVDCDRGRGPRHRRPMPFPEALRYMEGMAGAAWSTARTDLRGVGNRGD